MNNRLEALSCPNCGAAIDYLPSNVSEFRCEYCGRMIRLNAQPQNMTVNISEDFQQVSPEQIAQRVGRLFYLGKYTEAKQLLERMLIYCPGSARLQEMENQCDCFLTQKFGNYLKMLAVRTFLTKDEAERYKIEIDAFCRMVGKNAINSVNTPMLKKQNMENYSAILNYIADLKKCLINDAVIHSDQLYEAVRTAVLKLTAIVCNTVYFQKTTRFAGQHVMLIDLAYRRQLKEDFDAIDPHGETEYKIVDENVIMQYIAGG